MMPNFSHSGNPVYNQTALLNRISELEAENAHRLAAAHHGRCAVPGNGRMGAGTGIV